VADVGPTLTSNYYPDVLVGGATPYTVQYSGRIYTCSPTVLPSSFLSHFPSFRLCDNVPMTRLVCASFGRCIVQ